MVMMNAWQPSGTGALEGPVLRLGRGQVARADQGNDDHDAVEDDTEEFEEVLSPRFHNEPANIEEVMSPSLMEAQGEGVR